MATLEELKKQGLTERYQIFRADGTAPDPAAKYFVLRLDSQGNDPKHIFACRWALVQYANIIGNHLPVLAWEIQERYGFAFTEEVLLPFFTQQGYEPIYTGVDHLVEVLVDEGLEGSFLAWLDEPAQVSKRFADQEE